MGRYIEENVNKFQQNICFNIYLSMSINILIKAIFVGIAKVIPGLSGTILMICFNLYLLLNLQV